MAFDKPPRAADPHWTSDVEGAMKKSMLGLPPLLPLRCRWRSWPRRRKAPCPPPSPATSGR